MIEMRPSLRLLKPNKHLDTAKKQQTVLVLEFDIAQLKIAVDDVSRS